MFQGQYTLTSSIYEHSMVFQAHLVRIYLFIAILKAHFEEGKLLF